MSHLEEIYILERESTREILNVQNKCTNLFQLLIKFVRDRALKKYIKIILKNIWQAQSRPQRNVWKIC